MGAESRGGWVARLSSPRAIGFPGAEWHRLRRTGSGARRGGRPGRKHI